MAPCKHPVTAVHKLTPADLWRLRACAGVRSSACNGIQLFLTNPRQVDPVVAGGCLPATRTEVSADGLMLANTVGCSYKGDPDTYDLTTGGTSDTVVINQVGGVGRVGEWACQRCLLTRPHPHLRP